MIKIDDVEFVNEDGPDSVPFRIKFNGLSLQNGNYKKIEYGRQGHLIWVMVWALQYLNQ